VIRYRAHVGRSLTKAAAVALTLGMLAAACGGGSGGNKGGSNNSTQTTENDTGLKPVYGGAMTLALEADTTGSVNVIIANDDTIMERPSAELLAEVFPGVEVRGRLTGRETLLSNALARRVLGFEPRHSWRRGLPA